MLDDFLEQAEAYVHGSYNAWIKQGGLEAYLRRSRRCIRGKWYTSFEIANVNVRGKGKGKFTAFLKEVEAKSPYEIVFIENVFQKRFQDFFLKRGYDYVPGSEPLCLYKVIEHEQASSSSVSVPSGEATQSSSTDLH